MTFIQVKSVVDIKNVLFEERWRVSDIETNVISQLYKLT